MQQMLAEDIAYSGVLPVGCTNLTSEKIYTVQELDVIDLPLLSAHPAKLIDADGKEFFVIIGLDFKVGKKTTEI